MTFDRAKILAEGGTYHDHKNPLIEKAGFVAEKVDWEPVSVGGPAPAGVNEDISLPKRMVIEGVFQRFMPESIPLNDPTRVKPYRNANKRVYTMERVGRRVLDPAGDVQKRISERAMIGHVEHPADGTTDLMKGAILITKVWAEADGTIKGRALVYNTAPGQVIQEYAVTGTKFGISSRGTGTVDANGFVCEDFQLETWDIVYNPSTFGAYPGIAQESAESAPGTKPVVETAATAANIQPQQVAPMSLSKRIAEARAEASRLLAVDPKRLTAEGRAKLAGDLLDARAKIAKDFVGEDRIKDVEKLMAALDEARALAETTSDTTGGFTAGAAPEGQVATGVPGTWDALDKALGGMGAARAKVEGTVKSLADLIAANLGNLPKLQALEAALKGEQPAVTEAKHEELKALLREGRDEIITLAEREEAASAIIDELTTQVSALQAEVEAGKLRESKSATVIAELTGTAGKPKTDEAKDDKKPEGEKPKVDEAAPAKPVAKSLAERIAENAKKQANGAGALPEGKKVVSKDDAGDVKTKDDLTEGAKANTGKSGADLLVASGVAKRLTESQGTFR